MLTNDSIVAQRICNFSIRTEGKLLEKGMEDAVDDIGMDIEVLELR